MNESLPVRYWEDCEGRLKEWDFIFLIYHLFNHLQIAKIYARVIVLIIEMQINEKINITKSFSNLK